MARFITDVFVYFFVAFALVCGERPEYFITAPNVFHAGVEETISVSVNNIQQRVKLKLSIQDYPNKQKNFSSAEVVLDNDQPKIVKLKINPEDLPDTEPDDKLFVYLAAYSFNPNLAFVKYAKILVSRQNAVVFIQTDKPIYTPGHTVQIRVIPLGFDLRSSKTKINLFIKHNDLPECQLASRLVTPLIGIKMKLLSQPCTVCITESCCPNKTMNPQQIRVQQWNGLVAETGFISKNLNLERSSLIGNWTVSAFYGYQFSKNTTVTFEVREYVLPKYSVKITGPGYILSRDKTIDITVTSRYTYGKAVEGSVFVKFHVVGRGKASVFLGSEQSMLNSSKKIFKLRNELVKNHLLIQKFPTGRRLQIEAEVVEKATGRKENAIDNSIYFVESPFIINFDKTPKFFKPGLPFQAKVQLFYPNKTPAKGITIRMRASATDTRDVKIDVLGKVNGKNVLNLRDRTNDKGLVYFIVDVPRNAKTLKIELETEDANLPNTKKEIAVKSYQSPSGSYLLIRERKEKKEVKRYEVYSNANFTRLSYMAKATLNYNYKYTIKSWKVVARGKIIQQGSMKRKFGVVTTLQIPISPELSPAARLIVYCTVKGNEIVADSLIIDTEDKLPNEIGLSVETFPSGKKSRVFTPGANCLITIKAKPNTRIAVLGLDQSVYLLRNKYKLTHNNVFKKLELLDLGCGVGPQETNKKVFEKAGMTVISNRNLVTNPREEFGCKELLKRKKRAATTDPKVLQMCCDEGMQPQRWSCKKSVQLRFQFGGSAYTDDCLRTFYNCCLIEWGDPAFPFDKIVDPRQRNSDGDDFQDVDIFNEETENGQDRTDFHEMFIYDESVVDDNGHLSIPVTLPHTITSWSVQALGTSNTSGFGMAAPLSIRTYKPFFLSVSLPYSVQRGEQFAVMITLFNYQDEINQIGDKKVLKVEVYIEGSRDFCSTVRAGQQSKLVTLNVKPQDTQSVMFPIVPITLGQISIKVKAKYKQMYISHYDAVEKQLLVVPEGVVRTITHSLVLDPQGVLRDEDKPNKTTPTAAFQSGRILSNGKQTDNVFLKIPKRTIPGSLSATLSLTGNLIGPVVTNLIKGGFEELLRMPTGCGEQTMIFLAPNVYVLQYLTNTKQVTADIESRAYRHIQSGYQTELNYRRKDKSFSAFGESRPGSTWLTAFVMRVFCAAQKFGGISIDEDLICESVTWLVKNQRADGAFPERHDVVHKSMTGGIHGDVSMTSFVLMSLMECSCKGKKNSDAVSRAVSYLEVELSNVYRPHAVAMTTYALVLAKSQERFKANQKLIQMAKYDSDKAIRHWDAGGMALSIETSAYALLTQVLMGRVKYAGPIVRWLTAQRNAAGGFSSTQDTCVALEALAKYSERTAGAKLNLRVEITAERDSNFRRIVHITNQNALVMKQEDISDVMGGEIFIDSSGYGVGQLQIEVRRNVPSSRNESCLFEVKTVVKEFIADSGASVLARSNNNYAAGQWLLGRAKRKGRKKCRGKKRRNKKKCRRQKKQKTQPKPPKSLVIKTCTRYLKPGKSGMTIMDIGIFTGFEADSKSLEQLKENVRPTVDKFEISDRHVVLYISEVYHKKEFCAMFRVNRVHKVGTIQAVPIKVYDYYEPGETCTIFYGPEKNSALELGICEGEQCRCTQDSCTACNPAVNSSSDLLTKACNDYDYAFRGRVGLIDEEQKRKQSWLSYSLVVKEVIKPGTPNFAVGELVEFMKRVGCRCPDMKLHKDYLVMGKYNRGQFIFDDTTYVKRWPRRGLEKKFFMDFRVKMKSRKRCR